MGPELMDLFREQAKRFGAECYFKKVTKVDFTKRPFKVWVTDQVYQAEAVIIATGASARWLGLESEKSLLGYGVSACATCDGFFFKDKRVLVVGGGDAAMEEAIFLTKFASQVIVVHRRDALRASKIMQERAFKNPRIEFWWNTIITLIHGSPETGVTGVSLQDTTNGATREEPCDGVFLAIGHKPNTDLFENILEMDDRGYLVTKDGSTATSIPGVFACGDAQDRVYRQAITAAGSGCMAALDSERFLELQEEV